MKTMPDGVYNFTWISYQNPPDNFFIMEHETNYYGVDALFEI